MDRKIVWDELKGMVLISKKGEVKVPFGKNYFEHKIWLDSKAAVYDMKKAEADLKNLEARLKQLEQEKENAEAQIKDYKDLIHSYARIKGKLIDAEITPTENDMRQVQNQA